MTQRYDAFLSYSHHDSRLAERISRRLRTYKPPRRSGLSRRLQVFRDVERLTAASSLSDLLDERISASQHLVLLASPESAESDYVNREVEAFLSRNDASSFRIVLVRGEIKDSLPSTLRNAGIEPLFIDLRGAGRQRFANETLRLIASIFCVDYSELRRQDETRRQRRRTSALAGSIGAALLLVASYLATTIPAEAWRQVSQPVAKSGTDALMPVEQVAIRRSNPNTVVWFARNARHASMLDRVGTYWTLDGFDALSRTNRFRETARENRSGLMGKPLLVLSLSAEDDRGNRLLDLNSRMIALSDTGGPLYAVRSELRLPGGRREILGLTEVEPGDWLSRLEPEPAGSLRRLGFAGRDLQGEWIDHTNEGEVVPALFLGNRRDDAKEVLDATASAEFLLFSNLSTLNTELQEQQQTERADDLWTWQFVSNEDWLVPSSPALLTRSIGREKIDGAGSPVKTGLGATSRSSPDGTGPDAACLRSLGAVLPAAELYLVRTVKRPGVAAATVEPIWDHHEVVQQPAPIHLVQVEDQPWRQAVLPAGLPRIQIVDVHRSTDVPSLLFLVTDRAGVFRSRNFGVTWEEANFAEAALRQATNIKFVLAPGPSAYALAILHNKPGEDSNPLFRLEKRNWITRCRLGLARILSDGPPQSR